MWTTTTRPFRVTGIDSANLGTFGVNVQGIAYTRPNGQQGVTFVWAGRDQASIYSLTSLDGGQRWGDVVPIVYRQSGETLAFVSPAYDAAADRLVALWLCCGEQQSTHYASWSAPGARWQPRYDASSATPLVFGSRAGASAVLRDAVAATVAVNADHLAVTITNRSARPFSLFAGDVMLVLGDQPQTLDLDSAALAPLAPGEQRILTFAAPSTTQDYTVAVGPFAYHVTPD